MNANDLAFDSITISVECFLLLVVEDNLASGEVPAAVFPLDRRSPKLGSEFLALLLRKRVEFIRVGRDKNVNCVAACETVDLRHVVASVVLVCFV